MSSVETVGFVFPGQGAQRAGMGLIWRDSPSWAIVGRISEMAGCDVAELLTTADDESLRRTDLAQLAVYATSMVALDHLRASGVDGAVFAGHSLGEYSALVAAEEYAASEGKLIRIPVAGAFRSPLMEPAIAYVA